MCKELTTQGRLLVTPIQEADLSVPRQAFQGNTPSVHFGLPCRQADDTIRKFDVQNSRFEGINDFGTTVGQLLASGRLQGFLVFAADLPQPIPEPGSLQRTLIGAAILLLVY